ncbi:MAG: ABC transporter permease [Dehalococcoidales bacterium]|jgi:peptide/nickel transport system permease protein|nr:ABC transporter permease [Dehalococcoidales bacterium]
MREKDSDPEIKTKPVFSGLSRRARIFKKLTLIIPVTILTLIILMAIFADLAWLGLPDVRLAPYNPEKMSLPDRLMPPFWAEGGSTEHLLGTDKMGRDILSRLIFGARISISVSLLVILITSFVGTILGIIAGYLGGRTEAFLMRITDISMAFPPILVAMLLCVSMGPSFTTVVLAISLLGWAPYARLIRGEALKLREEDFIAQARIIGTSPFRIMLRHIFPNIVNPLIIVMTLQIGLLIITEASLSFLGVGIPPPAPSWGNMVNDGRNLVDTAWWISTFPGIAIGLVVMSGNFFGDWLRDKLDPRLRQL